MGKRMRVLSLCTGIGGIDLACEATGAMEIVGQVELDDFCTSVLAYHWPHVQRMRDLMEVRGDEFGAVELVVAGFPCQPTSHAGKRRGASDDRWLWPEVHRVIRCARPTWVLCENVPGLITLGLDDVLRDLDSAGYEATTCVYPASAVGAPHQRERVFIVGHANRANRQTGDLPASQSVARQSCRATATHDVADTTGTRLAHRQQSRQRTYGAQGGTGMESEPERYSGIVADAAGKRRGTRRPESARQCGQTGANGSGDVMVYASGTGREECHTSRVAGDTGHASGRRDTNGRNGQAQSGVGVAAHGLPGRLAGHPGWPARPSEAQYEWEAPRTVPANDRMPQRAAKLKALGNAVVPQQVLPILQAIAETWLAEQ